MVLVGWGEKWKTAFSTKEGIETQSLTPERKERAQKAKEVVFQVNKLVVLLIEHLAGQE